MTLPFLLLIGSLICFIIAFLEYQNQPRWNRAIAAGLVALVGFMLAQNWR